jgi:hypothetical protein
MSGGFVPICAIAGSCAGLISGALHSVQLAAIGALIGLPIGLGSYFAISIPYVFWIVRHEQRHSNLNKGHPYEPPVIWTRLFLPLMIGCVFATIALTWMCVRALALNFG